MIKQNPDTLLECFFIHGNGGRLPTNSEFLLIFRGQIQEVEQKKMREVSLNSQN